MPAPPLISPSMGDAEEADYAAALGGEQTELAPSESGTEAHTAWALDDGPEWKPPFWTSGRVTAVVVGVAVVAVVVAAGVSGYHLRGDAPAAAPSTTAVPTTAVPKTTVKPPPQHGWGIPTTKRTTTTPPPPETVTVTKEAPQPAQPVAAPAQPIAPTYLPDLAPFDGVFISTIQVRGWEVWDGQLMLERAHSTCSMMRAGEPQSLIAAKLIGVERQLTVPLANSFINTVRDVYPACG